MKITASREGLCFFWVTKRPFQSGEGKEPRPQVEAGGKGPGERSKRKTARPQRGQARGAGQRGNAFREGSETVLRRGQQRRGSNPAPLLQSLKGTTQGNSLCFYERIPGNSQNSWEKCFLNKIDSDSKKVIHSFRNIFIGINNTAISYATLPHLFSPFMTF